MADKSPTTTLAKHIEIPPSLPIFLSTAEAASTGYACTRTIRRLCASGKIYAFKIGGYWKIPRDRFIHDIQEHLL